MKKNLFRLKASFLEWGLVIFLFLALRLGGLLFFHPFHSALFPTEEYYRGTLGKAILDGLFMPYWHYRPDDFAGGSLPMGILAAVFFKLFGSSAFVLKSISVLISLGTLLIWFKVLDQEFSRKCAWYFSLFFIFAPPAFQIYSMVPLGDHYETMFLSALAVGLFLKAERNKREEEGIRRKNRERNKARTSSSSPFLPFLPPSSLHFLLGIVCGFGTWFAYIFMLTFLAILTVWFRRDRHFVLKRHFWFFAAGFLIGFSPWIFINLQIQFNGFSVNGISILNHLQFLPWSPKTFFLRDIFTLFLPAAGRWHPGYLEVKSLYVILLTAPVIVWFFLRLYQNEKGQRDFSKPGSDVSLYFILYAFFHCLAVEFTDFQAERYMMPLMPAIFFGWARVMESLESISPRIRFWNRIFFAAPLLGLGAVLWISMISPAYAGSLLKIRGYAYDYLARIPECSNYDACLSLHRKIAEKLSPQDQSELWTAFAERAAGEWVDRNEHLSSEMPFVSPSFYPAFYFHFGHYYLDRKEQLLQKAFLDFHKEWEEQSPEFQIGFLGMLYQFESYPIYERPYLINREQKPSLLSNGYFRVVGTQYTVYWRNKGVPMKQLYEISQTYVSGWSAQNRENFFRGMGQSVIQNLHQSPVIQPGDYKKVKEVFAKEDQKAFFQGLGQAKASLLHFFPEEYKSWGLRAIAKKTDPEVEEWIQQGFQSIDSIVQALRIARAIP